MEGALRQIGPPFGIAHSAAHRIVDSLDPLLALAPVRKRRVDQVANRRMVSPSKNDRYSTNLPFAIDVDSRQVFAISEPQPGNRNDTAVYRESGMGQKLAGRAVMADGGYRGDPDVIMPYRKHDASQALPQWQQNLNATHRRTRARVEYVLAGMKTWNGRTRPCTARANACGRPVAPFLWPTCSCGSTSRPPTRIRAPPCPSAEACECSATSTWPTPPVGTWRCSRTRTCSRSTTASRKHQAAPARHVAAGEGRVTAQRAVLIRCGDRVNWPLPKRRWVSAAARYRARSRS